MADILSDLYPVPVQWVDGQQPTAQELNAWAGLIDTAFAILSRLIGDFDGESSEQATYITNFVRAMGSLGWINPRLPRGLDQQGSITPTLVELLNPSLLSKEHLLLFPPKNYASISADFDADDTYGDDWTKVDQGTEDIPGANLTAASQWTAWGRRLITSTRIPLNAKVKYVIDTDGATLNSQDYMGSYGPNSGANVVPSLYEIAESGLDLCVYDTDEFDDSGEHWLTLPKILRCMDPYKPLHSAESINFESVSIHWFSEETTPSYVVPNYIYDLADEDGRLPDGLVSLWVKTSTSIYRLVNQNSEEQIAFYVEADRTRIRLSLPDGFDLPHTADGQEALATQYIVAFAGVSITEAVAQNTARQIIHRHDGTDDGSLVKAVSIANRFEPSQYTESPVSHNHFPQYLLRGGYTADADHLNRHNALLGPILIAQEGATPSNTAEPSIEATTSHGLFFGSYVVGAPFISFYSPDTAAGNSEFDFTGKLTFWNKSVRFTDMIFLGPVLGGGWISAEDGYFTLGMENLNDAEGTVLEAGCLVAFNNTVEFGGHEGNAAGAIVFSDNEFKVSRGGDIQDSLIRTGQVRTRGIKLITDLGVDPVERGDIQFARHFIAPSLWTPFMRLPWEQPDGAVFFGNKDIMDGEGNDYPDFDLGIEQPMGWWTKAIEGLFMFFVPLNIPESRSAANLSLDEFIDIQRIELLVQNTDNTPGDIQVEFFQQEKATGATTLLWTSPVSTLLAEQVSPELLILDDADDSGDEALSELAINITDNSYFFKVHAMNGMGLFGLTVPYSSHWLG